MAVGRRPDRPDHLLYAILLLLLLLLLLPPTTLTTPPPPCRAQGGDFFVHQLAERLNSPSQEGGGGGRKCYEIPCGGSNVLGTFGYMHAITELMQQCGVGTEQQQEGEGEEKKRSFPFDHLVLFCALFCCSHYIASLSRLLTSDLIQLYTTQRVTA